MWITNLLNLDIFFQTFLKKENCHKVKPNTLHKVLRHLQATWEANFLVCNILNTTKIHNKSLDLGLTPQYFNFS